MTAGIGFLNFIPQAAQAQIFQTQYFYSHLRPANLDWQQIKTNHFRIIFPASEDSLAFRSAEILENHYSQVKELTGGSLVNFPVVLRNYNDLSNGMVTTLNFRSEIDLAPIKGKDMNPVTGGWLENVLPHELVHASHFNVQQVRGEKKISIPAIISYFSPDMARSVHGFVPSGFHEGLAVHYESEYVHPDGGRSNYTYFYNRFNANFGSPDRWNIGQTLIINDYSLPGLRHYLAGSSFVNWLQEQYGPDFSKNAIRFHYHQFMFGFGYTLKRKTGLWPNQLFELYTQHLQEKEDKRLREVSQTTTEAAKIPDVPYKGIQMRAPKWLNSNEILFYGSFYNARLGFYKYNIRKDELDFITESFAVSDYHFTFDENNNLIFSGYDGSLLYPGVFLADLYSLDLQNGKMTQITDGERVHSPAYVNGKLLALQTDGRTGRIVEVTDEEIKPVKEFTEAVPVHISVNPANRKQLAVVLNLRGTQALWITNADELQNLEGLPALAFRNGSIHDPVWNSNGEHILFTMDASPAMNVFEYNVVTGNVVQITNSAYNAFEASYSPDENAIAYVIQAGDERKIAFLQNEDFLNKPVDDSLFLSADELEDRFQRKLTGEGLFENRDWEVSSYKTDWTWLKPRLVLPVIRENANTIQSGVSFSSIDVLQSQSYQIELTGIQNRLWYDFSYSNRSFYPGLDINAYSEPLFFAAVNPHTQENIALMRQDRGISLSVPFDFIFRNNTRSTGLFIEPEISAEQYKFYNLTPDPLSDFATRYKAGIFSQYYYNLMALPRDVQPSAGWVFFGLFEQTLNESKAALSLEGGEAIFEFGNQWAAYYGAYTYLSTLRRFNQSLRLDLRFLQQSSSPIYSNSTIVPMGFEVNPFPTAVSANGVRNIGRFSTRYTIPLLYPDNGWLTLPLYLSSIYLTAFSHTLTDLNSSDLLASSRSIFGAGVHVQWKLSNISFEIGLGLSYEPSRNNLQLIYGQF